MAELLTVTKYIAGNVVRDPAAITTQYADVRYDGTAVGDPIRVGNGGALVTCWAQSWELESPWADVPVNNLFSSIFAGWHVTGEDKWLWNAGIDSSMNFMFWPVDGISGGRYGFFQVSDGADPIAGHGSNPLRFPFPAPVLGEPYDVFGEILWGRENTNTGDPVGHVILGVNGVIYVDTRVNNPPADWWIHHYSGGINVWYPRPPDQQSNAPPYGYSTGPKPGINTLHRKPDPIGSASLRTQQNISLYSLWPYGRHLGLVPGVYVTRESVPRLGHGATRAQALAACLASGSAGPVRWQGDGLPYTGAITSIVQSKNRPQYGLQSRDEFFTITRAAPYRIQTLAVVDPHPTHQLLSRPRGGTWKLRFGAGGEKTAALQYNASAATVQAALEALGPIAPGDVAVSGGPFPGAALTFTFAGAYATGTVPLLLPEEVQFRYGGAPGESNIASAVYLPNEGGGLQAGDTYVFLEPTGPRRFTTQGFRYPVLFGGPGPGDPPGGSPAPPVNTVAPVISGTFRSGQTLTGTDGTWDGAPTDLIYQWEYTLTGGRDWLATGTDLATLLLTDAHVGHGIRLGVSAVNADGTSSPAYSNVLGPVTLDATGELLVNGDFATADFRWGPFLNAIVTRPLTAWPGGLPCMKIDCAGLDNPISFEGGWYEFFADPPSDGIGGAIYTVPGTTRTFRGDLVAPIGASVRVSLDNFLIGGGSVPPSGIVTLIGTGAPQVFAVSTEAPADTVYQQPSVTTGEDGAQAIAILVKNVSLKEGVWTPPVEPGPRSGGARSGGTRLEGDRTAMGNAGLV